MIVGPRRDAQMIELGVREEERETTIHHAMTARTRFLR